MPLREKDKQSSASGYQGQEWEGCRFKGTQTGSRVCSLLVSQGFTVINRCVCDPLYLILIHGPAR